MHEIEFIARHQYGGWSNLDYRFIEVIDGIIYRPDGGGILRFPPDESGWGFHDKDADSNAESGGISSASSSGGLGQASATAKLGILYGPTQQKRTVKISTEMYSVGGKDGFASSSWLLRYIWNDIHYFQPYVGEDIDQLWDWDLVLPLLLYYVGLLCPPSWVGLVASNFINIVLAWMTISSYQELKEKLENEVDTQKHRIEWIKELPAWSNHKFIVELQTNAAAFVAGGNAARSGQIPFVCIEEVETSREYSVHEGKMKIYGYGPINLTIIDPSGNLLNGTYSSIPGSEHARFDFNNDSHVDNYFFIPNAINGTYNITLSPNEYGNSNDTFSLIVDYESNYTTIVENETISNLTLDPSYIFNVSSVNPPFVQLNYPSGYETLNQTIPITWIATDYEEGNNLPISLFYSNDKGENWSIIDTDLVNDGEYEWNTTSVLCGSYMLKVETNDSDGNIRYDTSNEFVIRNNNWPVASFGYYPSNPATQDIINFTSFSIDFDGFIVNWSWDFGDGATSFLPHPTHQYNSPGMYTVCLTVIDDDDGDDSVSQEVEVFDILAPEISDVIAYPSLQIVGEFVNISATVIDNVCVDEVYLCIEYPDLTEQNFSITQNTTGDTYYCNWTYQQIGNYSYHLWANDTSRNSNISQVHTFQVLPPPNSPPVFGSPDPVNGSTGNPLSLNWSIPISDHEGDIFSWTIQCSNGQSNSGSGDTNGTKSLALSNLSLFTTYMVWVNATDPSGSNQYTHAWYTFTTRDNSPPYTPSEPSPSDGAINVSIDSDLSWNGGDPDGDPVTYDVYFGTTTPPPQAATGLNDTIYNPGLLDYGTKYYWKIIVWDDQNAFTQGPIWEFTTIFAVPDLDCTGTLSWNEVTPGETVTGEFTVENIGDPTSLLDWEIESYPEWGIWTFSPNGDTGLTPEDGAITVTVEVVAPDEQGTEFTGEVTLINSNDPSDSCTIDAALATPLSHQQSVLMSFYSDFHMHFQSLEKYSVDNIRNNIQE